MLNAQFTDAGVSPRNEESVDPGVSKLMCMDCPAPYGEDGWRDVIIPNETWNKIASRTGESETDDPGGVLCFRCMTKRLERLAAAKAEGDGVTDTERLNWLGYCKHGFVRGTDFSKWTIESLEEGLRTIRQAIDAAMAATERGEKT